jgi:hypothetical protein
MEVDDGIKTIIDYMYRKTPPWKLIIGSGVDEAITHRFSRYTSTAGSFPGVHWQGERRTKVIVKYYGQVGIDTYSESHGRRLGFDPSNWAPTIWELVPYSFLIDYFVNVDDIVSAATLSRSGLRWTSKTVVKEITEFLRPTAVVANTSSSVDYRAYHGCQPGVTYRLKTVDRNPYVGSLVPSLQLSLPTLPKQLMNITALLNNSRTVSNYLSKLFK